MTSDISTPLSVVGMDGPAGGREALQWAVAHAELSGAAVQAVMAWQLPEVYSMASRDYEADARRELQTAIENALSPDQRSHVTSQVVAARPGHVLADASRNPQLLVVGSHGQKAVPTNSATTFRNRPLASKRCRPGSPGAV